jgi:hypothetical protein
MAVAEWPRNEKDGENEIEGLCCFAVSSAARYDNGVVTGNYLLHEQVEHNAAFTSRLCHNVSTY